MKVSPLLLLISAAVLIIGCDSVTGPASGLDEAYEASQRPLPAAFSAPTLGTRGVAVCHRVDEERYTYMVVAHKDVKEHLLHGDEHPGGALLDGNCNPVVTVAACPCYAAADLGAPFGSAAPQPYVFFDVYGYYSEDVRRTEARATLHTEAGLFEEVAAVYITPTGDRAQRDLRLRVSRAVHGDCDLGAIRRVVRLVADLGTQRCDFIAHVRLSL